MPDDPPILNYGKAKRGAAPERLIGILACGLLILAGAGIVAFGIWNFRNEWSVNKGIGAVLTLVATIVLGLAVVLFSLRWLVAALLARRDEKLERE